MRLRWRCLPVFVGAIGAIGVLACGSDDKTLIVIESEPVAKAAVATEGPILPETPTLSVLSDYKHELVETQRWLNSEPTTIKQLRDAGQVVLIDFWTYSCYNCVNTFPSLKAWHEKYSDQGLTILGVHSPEFEFEKKYENVVAAAEEHGLKYPIVQDNDFHTWRAFGNHYWPSIFLIDADGNLRYRHIGEGAYAETEQAVRALLTEAGNDVSAGSPVYQ
ncbi:MAG: redoxin domain-containing protein [Chloroflexi bacterium]|nr:redoxin domain-containing protein [Chloroflexota bacterium]